ncbi:SulP family inorganic anion transporter [Desulfobotulus sp.]|uniref:SulP family inorganic anion transporter n=1 Tax=Desulfobotulus sp. TaxID=1940337 RepID=UPI002A359042|nr:SulP family inorganic anion transporter [Desulfobotulus sp.]MDY0162780.1 SulP family inorganic anion transporter [Desulfobotulus sp.]
MHFSLFRYLTEHFQPESRILFSRTYFPDKIVQDLGAGLTVGIVALPLAIAFAIASGCSPEQGLFTAIVAGFLISLLGGSRFQIGGPTGAFVAIIAGIMAQHGYEGLAVATLLAGIILFFMGVFRLGQMLKYIPYPVTTGFTAGIALFIFSTQLKEALGLETTSQGAKFLDRVLHAFSNIQDTDPESFALTLFTLFIMILVRRKMPKLPSHIAGILCATGLSLLLQLDVATIGSRFGGIPAGLPRFSIPANLWELIPIMIPSAFTIALLGGIESLLSATVADGMTGKRHKPDTELVAQGVANVASACFGGIPATGAIARTATNIRAGAQSPAAGMIHALVLLLCILFIAPLASRIPMACLAGVLIMVAWDMGEVHKFISLMKAPAEDILVMLTTFSLTILVDLTVAVQVGVVLAALLFMRRMSTLTHLSLHPPLPPENGTLSKSHEDAIQVYEIEGPFFFGVANRFLDVLQFLNTPPMVLILRLRQVKSIDATAAHALDIAIERIRKQKIQVFLSGVHPDVRRVMDLMQITRSIGKENFYPTFAQAMASAMTLVDAQKKEET